LLLPFDELIVPDGAMVYTFVPLPPAAVTVAVPLQLGTQVGLVDVLITNVNIVGSVITNVVVPTHDKALVADTVYVPAHKPLTTPVTGLKFCPGLFGAIVYVIPPTMVT
jgi:hypothetical protein